jgi:glucose-1-phosphate adenylyltransferase
MNIRRTLAVLLAGGAGERLYPLTRDRAKPAVTFGGIYRIIDVTLSNCVNSDLRKIMVFTQYKALSLNRHIRHGWYNVFAHDLDEFIEVIPPQKRTGESWYLGTADAVRQNLYSINSVDGIDFVLILPGDHIYKMNYARMLNQHVDSGADITIGTIDIPRSESGRFGVVQVDAQGKIYDFQEKPETPPCSRYNPACVTVSMGIYIFNTGLLLPVLEEDARNPDSTHDFGKDIIPRLTADCRVYAFQFVDENKKDSQYWLDVGTLQAYYEANLDLVAISPQFNLYDKDWPIRTYQRQYPPAKFVFAQEGNRMGIALDSIVSSGCIISGGRVRNSVLSPNVRVNSYCEIDRSILMSHVSIGRYSRIRNAIIDRGVHLPENTVIGFNLDEDKQKYFVTDSGIVVVAREDTNSEV